LYIYNIKMPNFVNTNGYIELWNPVSVKFQNTIPTTRSFMMKSLFSDNAKVFYKQGSNSYVTGSAGVRNSGIKSRRT
jgi:hypothetical protein